MKVSAEQHHSMCLLTQHMQLLQQQNQDWMCTSVIGSFLSISELWALSPTARINTRRHARTQKLHGIHSWVFLKLTNIWLEEFAPTIGNFKLTNKIPLVKLRQEGRFLSQITLTHFLGLVEFLHPF